MFKERGTRYTSVKFPNIVGSWKGREESLLNECNLSFPKRGRESLLLFCRHDDEGILEVLSIKAVLWDFFFTCTF